MLFISVACLSLLVSAGLHLEHSSLSAASLLLSSGAVGRSECPSFRQLRAIGRSWWF